MKMPFLSQPALARHEVAAQNSSFGADSLSRATGHRVAICRRAPKTGAKIRQNPPKPAIPSLEIGLPLHSHLDPDRRFPIGSVCRCNSRTVLSPAARRDENLGHSRLQVCATRQAAFTLVEVAISLAVIAFALVAILGLLPMGMEVQRDNRHDTIINQDGSYLIEAIRHGAQGIDDLTNYVDNFTSGAEVIRFLTQAGATNRLFMRSISGSAATKGPGTKDLTMRYEVTSQVVPAANIDTTVPYGVALAANLYEIRLLFRWPVYGPVGGESLSTTPNFQVFRTVVSGMVTNGFLNTALYR